MWRTRFILSLYLLSVAVGQCLGGRVLAAEVPRCAVTAGPSTIDPNATMVVIGKPKERLYFLSDHPDACAVGGTAHDCKQSAYLITGDKVLVGDTCGDWTVVEYSGKAGELFGWVESNRLAFAYDKSQRSEATCTKGIARTVDKEQHIKLARLPADVAEFVPQSKSVVELDCLDFKGLGFSRYFLILDSGNGDPFNLVLLARQPDKSLKVEAQNGDALVSPVMGGMRGGYQELEALAIGFRIYNDVGSASGFADSRFTFVYSSKQKTWVLEEVKIESSDGVRVQTKADFGVVTLNDFNGEPWGIGPP
jgi:hypothetical protein